MKYGEGFLDRLYKKKKKKKVRTPQPNYGVKG